MNNYYTGTFQLNHILDVKKKMLNWANQFNIFCLLENNAPNTIATQHHYIMAVAYNSKNAIASYNQLEKIDTGNWYFGHIAYTATQYTEHVEVQKDTKHQFEDVLLFIPNIIIIIEEYKIYIHSDENNCHAILEQITSAASVVNYSSEPILLHARLDRDTYVKKIEAIQQHLKKGNCYEINFCMEFFNNDATINPLQEYIELTEISPTPFSALYKVKEQYLICASPERYIQNTHNTIISQPIKGTIKRDITNKQHDEQLKLALRSNKKEISENVMVVDLVRNDLSKICEASTVTVPELMQVYTFPQLHHLISTIKGQLKERISFKQIIEATFPMGSMTGAPKHSVVQLINEFETGSRGIFAGTVGYISPNNHFDFNVIIRSILYNATSKYLSYWVGSGITIYSNPTDEYNECLLKAKAIEKTLS